MALEPPAAAPVAPSAPARRPAIPGWGLWSALALSLLLNLFLLTGAVRQYRARYQAELELARRKFPDATVQGADGGASDPVSARKDRAAKAKEKAAERQENRRERQARIALSSPTSVVITLRPEGAGPDGGPNGEPKKRSTPPLGRLVAMPTGGPLAVGVQGLNRATPGNVLRLWVQRGPTPKSGPPTLQHIGTLTVDGLGRANVLFDLVTGLRPSRAEVRLEPAGAVPKEPGGELVLSGNADPAE
jgi:hypothetical protein